MTYQEFKNAVIAVSEEMKVADYELYYTERESISVDIYKQEISEYSTDTGMGICYRCIRDGKAGYASTENLTEEEARSLVLRALENAGSIESEEKAFIHEKGDVYAVLPKEESPVPTGAELSEAALALQKEVYGQDSRVADGTQSYAGYASFCCALYNSKGLDLEDRSSYSSCMASALVSDGKEMYNGFEVKDGVLGEIDLKEIAAKAVEDAVSTIGADSMPSGKYNVVFTGHAFAQLLNTYSSVFSAEAAQKGMSLLKDKEGEKIAADTVTVIDDPMHEKSPLKRTFDGEGVATYKKNVIESGTLKTLLHNLTTAAKAGVKSTGNGQKASYASTVGVGPFTLYLNPVEGSEEEFLAAAETGVCIKDVSGLHAGANPITGDFSLLAEGYRFEEGKKTAPVKNITVSGNFFTLLKEIEKVGTDMKFIRSMSGKCGAPSVLVRNMTVAGQ
ncbi:MAG: TldD/PmbA family protein [Roseburia sp.]|nr:TldD/PmbA family protein [Roseburia sp.]MCM1097045.1 TldD/PmbA family protein [Ruminococcus flavefaciens]